MYPSIVSPRKLIKNMSISTEYFFPYFIFLNCLLSNLTPVVFEIKSFIQRLGCCNSRNNHNAFIFWRFKIREKIVKIIGLFKKNCGKISDVSITWYTTSRVKAGSH